jgi:hypothetical protein
MKNPTAASSLHLTALITLLVTGCSMNPAPSIEPASTDGLQYVTVDGKVVKTENYSLLELLEYHVPARRLGLHSPLVSAEPLLIIDNVPVHGLRMLASVRAEHTASVTLLRPIDAVTVYGGRASGGAIIVKTRSR